MPWGAPWSLALPGRKWVRQGEPLGIAFTGGHGLSTEDRMPPDWRRQATTAAPAYVDRHQPDPDVTARRWSKLAPAGLMNRVAGLQISRQDSGCAPRPARGPQQFAPGEVVVGQQ